MRVLVRTVFAAVALHAQLRLEIPFEHPHPDLPLVIINLGVNQTDGLQAVIDTGQGIAPLLLTPAAARNLHLNWSDSNRFESSFAVGNGPAPVVYKTQIQNIRLGRQSFPVQSAGVTSGLEAFATELQQPLVANLGYGFLKDYTLPSITAPAVPRSPASVSPAAPLSPSAPKSPSPSSRLASTAKVPSVFAIDTGASTSAVSRYLAERLMLPRGIPVPVLGGSGRATSYMTSAERLEVAGRTFSNLNLATGDFFGPLAQAVGSPVDGILGANAFLGLALTIDYPGKRVLLAGTN